MVRNDETGKAQSERGVREPIHGGSPAGPDADDEPGEGQSGETPVDEGGDEGLDIVDEWGMESFPASDPPAP